MTSCDFRGSLIGSIAGGIAGVNCGVVSNNSVLTGSINNGGVDLSTGGVIGFVYSPNGIDFTGVAVTGNTFSRAATGQQWGIGEDRRLSPAAPSNDGTTPVI